MYKLRSYASSENYITIAKDRLTTVPLGYLVLRTLQKAKHDEVTDYPSTFPADTGH
jgi:hypothetical protein